MTCCNHCQNCKDTIVEILLKPSNSYGTLSGTKKKKKKKTKNLGEKKKGFGSHTLSNFKTYYKATVNKTVWYHHKGKHTEL